MRALLIAHRLLGIAIGPLIAMWCVSGVVMLYVPYPALAAHPRRTATPTIAWDGCCTLSSGHGGARLEALDAFRVEDARRATPCSAERRGRPWDLISESERPRGHRGCRVGRVLLGPRAGGRPSAAARCVSSPTTHGPWGAACPPRVEAPVSLRRRRPRGDRSLRVDRQRLRGSGDDRARQVLELARRRTALALRPSNFVAHVRLWSAVIIGVSLAGFASWRSLGVVAG